MEPWQTVDQEIKMQILSDKEKKEIHIQRYPIVSFNTSRKLVVDCCLGCEWAKIVKH